MAVWKAYLENVVDTGPSVVVLEVRFEDDSIPKRIFTKKYTLDFNSPATKTELKKIVLNDLANLSAFGSLVDTIKTFIGQEIQ